MLEQLEWRRLFAATLAGGVLTVRGDAGSSQMSVAIVNKKLVATINGASERFTVGSVTSIKVLAYSGNDTIDLSGVSIPSNVGSGPGDDKIFASNASDKIAGSTGSDELYGNDGDDRLDGEAGSDLLSGGDGTDTADYSVRIEDLTLNVGDGSYDSGAPNENDNIQPDVEAVLSGSGDDLIYGTDADNLLSGGSGNDTIFGGDEYDTINGGNGNDDLFGDDGNDRINGGNGNDLLVGGDNNDRLYGGNGNDVLNALDGEVGDGVDGGNGYDVGKLEYEYDYDSWDWDNDDADAYSNLDSTSWYYVCC